MEPYHIRYVPVDGAATDVLQFRFADGAYFVLSETANVFSWLNYCDRTISSIWVYALPSPDQRASAPNPWKIALELQNSKMITIELYNTESVKGTVFMLRTFTDNKDEGNSNDWKKLTTNGICHIGRRMNAGITLRDVILQVQASGLSTYQLKDGRGRRFWILETLNKIGHMVHEPVKWMLVGREADELLRRCWVGQTKDVEVYRLKVNNSYHEFRESQHVEKILPELETRAQGSMVDVLVQLLNLDAFLVENTPRLGSLYSVVYTSAPILPSRGQACPLRPFTCGGGHLFYILMGMINILSINDTFIHGCPGAN
ncbi:uncharacterized protein F4807DRAFT_458402 [Annulohypoxylon truncatum]|uniref:uncharacterized protein n=1 Tax=Annulohypoxylon truncatum TaxID=327061 RepID=UPI002007BE79|nr:uncharacterized protein F4807DRAFT_458402 [Annulohypoxylon truncatum]KAI1211506.1 hypothetical protein F4807DRAFT_458402 [Annulohypoxylon truncatum]